MDWKTEKDNLFNLIYKEQKSYDEIGKMYNVSGHAVRKAAQRLGINLPKRRTINPLETFNKGKISTRICKYCGKVFAKYPGSTGLFCSEECAVKYKKEQRIKEWKEGHIDGTNGYSCSTFVRNYLLQKHNYKCEKCGWSEVNPYTNKIPLQIHHIDGDSKNNIESNLQVLCPNCHSLTKNFGSRNKNAPRGKSAYYGKAKMVD